MQIKTFKPTSHFLKVLIYGAAGSGKTVFTGTAPKAIFASAESGLLSIADKSPSFVEVKTVKDLTDLYSFLSTQEHPYETVVIDSITEINEIIKLEIEKRVGRSMQLQDWGELSKKIRELFRKFRDLPMNVILVAQEHYMTDEDRIKKIVPSLNGKAATEIAYFMDIVGYINVENDGTRWMETNTNKKLLTKDRSRLIGNDAPLDFSEWQKRVAKMEIGEQKVTTSYVDHVNLPRLAAQKPTNNSAVTAVTDERPQLLALKLELQKKGAKTTAEALGILNSIANKEFKSFSELDEETAHNMQIIILMTPDKEIEEKKAVKIGPVLKKTPKK